MVYYSLNLILFKNLLNIIYNPPLKFDLFRTNKGNEVLPIDFHCGYNSRIQTGDY